METKWVSYNGGMYEFVEAEVNWLGQALDD